MALPHQSIATISSPQFINLQPLDVNPLMSACEIKVLYIGENRNRSFISKEVATQMAKTLRGAPIVGYYREEKDDFTNHGEQMIWDDEGIHFNCLTKPYGFVAPDAKVWFQKFNDLDDFGNTIERQYLMTTGYLWTGQFEEVASVLTEGKPQSMELDENSLEGHWATNNNSGIEFFIINDAIFSKLCILGDATEPCFEGASVTKPEISSTFSLDMDENFKQTLFSMLNDLKDALKGGQAMVKEDMTPAVEEEVVTTEFAQEEETSEPETDSTLDTSESEVDIQETFEAEVAEAEAPAAAVDYKEKDQEEEEKESQSDEEEAEEEDDKDKKYSLLEQQYEELSTQYSQLKEEYDSLLAFKEKVEDEQKDALIKEFYMLSDEDKEDIIQNKRNYSLDEIKAKLAVICYEKKVNFNSEDSSEIDKEVVITYNFNDDSANLPDWVRQAKKYDAE